MDTRLKHALIYGLIFLASSVYIFFFLVRPIIKVAEEQSRRDLADTITQKLQITSSCEKINPDLGPNQVFAEVCGSIKCDWQKLSLKKLKELNSSLEARIQKCSDQQLIYKCPVGEYVDCMPTVGEPSRPQCEPAYLRWAQVNCPGFKGAAY